MTPPDFGILLEIFGFLLFLISARESLKTREGYLTINEGKESPRREFNFLHWEIPGELGQATRMMAIGLVVFGLILQFSWI